jgi:hypothetical protein
MRRTVVAGALVLATAACAPPGAGPAAAPAPRPTLAMPTGSPSAEQAQLRARAVAVLKRWDGVADAGDRVGVVVQGGPTMPDWSGSVGEWEPALQEIGKVAATSGMVVAATALPTAPAWEFTVEGSAARLTRIAIAPADVRPVTPTRAEPRHFPEVSGATVDVTGLRLSTEFMGMVNDGDRDCGADYTAEVVESTRGVVVLVYEHRNASAVACRAIGRMRTLTTTLATPLGDRTVVELNAGLPVPVTHG